MKPRLTLTLLFLVPVLAHSQLALWVKDNNTAEFSSYVNVYGIFPENGKADFLLRDWRLQIEGTQGLLLDYKFQVDVANLIYSQKSSAVLDAKLSFNMSDQFELTVGYQLVPFSRNSMLSFRQSPFFQRTTLADGNLFARRDMGLLLQKKALKNQFTGYAGVFGGSGKINPFHRKPGITAVARAEMAFPSRFRYEEIDIHQSPVPRVVVGANALYSSQQTDSLSFNLPFLVNGNKWVSGVDAAFCYQGVSFQGEWIYAQVSPADVVTGLKYPYHVSGSFVSGNYYFRRINTTLAFRYETHRVDLPDMDRVKAARVAVNYFLDNSQRRILRLDYCFYSTYESENLQSGLGKGVRLGVQLGL